MNGYGYREATPGELAAVLAVWLVFLMLVTTVAILVAQDRAATRVAVHHVDAMLDCALLAEEGPCP